MGKRIRMCDLKPGQIGEVISLGEECSLTNRLLDLGLIEGSRVACLFRSVWRDPAAYRICGAAIALRRKDCRDILLREIAA